ncbi:MAG: hypothetical protein Q9220_005732 [cf. Caloplaca sp. 1 TL-2023]
MPSALGSQREQLLHALKGHELRIPDLKSLLKDWPQYENPELESLRDEVDEWLERLSQIFRLLKSTNSDEWAQAL